jgi:hypothetical protein
LTREALPGSLSGHSLLKLCEGLRMSLGELMLKAEDLYEKRLGR